MTDKSSISEKEISRRYRVAKQTLAMHCDLRDHFARVGLSLEMFFMVFAAITAATTFANDDLYLFFFADPGNGRLIIGLLSVLAFAGSLVLLLLNPRGESSKHGQAADRWTVLVLEFRERRSEEGAWAESDSRQLSCEYARVCDICVRIPDRKFNKLKSRYLQKVEISKLKDKHSGCPIMILRLACRWRDTCAAIKKIRESSENETKK